MPARWPGKKSLIILTALLDAVEPKTHACILNLMDKLKFKKFDWRQRFGTYIDLARSKLIQDARKVGPWDYVLFVDDDVVFLPEDLVKLREALDRDPKMGAISASYCFRDGSGRTTMNWRDPEQPDNDLAMLGERAALDKALEHSKNGDIVPVDVMPAGFLLMTGEVLESLPAPAFSTRWVARENEQGEKAAHFVGEDVYLCKLLQKMGYHPSAHFGVQIGHIGKITFGLVGQQLYRLDPESPVR